MFDYTTKKDFVIFDIPLLYFMPSIDVYEYNKDTKQRTKTGTRALKSMQDYEEDFYVSFYNDYYRTEKDIYDFDDKKQEVINHIKKEIKATPEELDLYDEMIISDIERAVNGAFDSSYQFEWLEKYRKALGELIEEKLNDQAFEWDYYFKDSKTLPLNDNHYMRENAENEEIQIKVSKKEIKRFLNQELDASQIANIDFKSDEYINYFVDTFYNLGGEVKTEHIDYYGTLGNDDDWLNYFIDYNESIINIKQYREDEKQKINNKELAAANLKPELNRIADYTKKYIKDTKQQEKIKRQVKALKSVIKN